MKVKKEHVIDKSNSSVENNPIKTGDTELVFVDKIKYLGNILNEDGYH